MNAVATAYHKETTTAIFQGKPIVLENLTPVLAPKAREQRKREGERACSTCSSSMRTHFVNHSQHCDRGLSMV